MVIQKLNVYLDIKDVDNYGTNGYEPFSKKEFVTTVGKKDRTFSVIEYQKNRNFFRRLAEGLLATVITIATTVSLLICFKSFRENLSERWKLAMTSKIIVRVTQLKRIDENIHELAKKTLDINQPNEGLNFDILTTLLKNAENSSEIHEIVSQCLANPIKNIRNFSESHQLELIKYLLEYNDFKIKNGKFDLIYALRPYIINSNNFHFMTSFLTEFFKVNIKSENPQRGFALFFESIDDKDHLAGRKAEALVKAINQLSGDLKKAYFSELRNRIKSMNDKFLEFEKDYFFEFTDRLYNFTKWPDIFQKCNINIYSYPEFKENNFNEACQKLALK